MVKFMGNETPESKETDFGEKVEKFYIREGDNVQTRTDWSLIFHAILLEAFFTVFEGHLRAAIPVAFLGIFTSVSGLLVGLKQNQRMAYLEHLLRSGVLDANCPSRLAIALQRAEEKFQTRYRIRARVVYNVLFPAALTVVWMAAGMLLLYKGGVFDGMHLTHPHVVFTVGLISALVAFPFLVWWIELDDPQQIDAAIVAFRSGAESTINRHVPDGDKESEEREKPQTGGGSKPPDS